MALRRRHDVVLPSTDHRAGSRFPRIAFALPAAMLKRSEPSQLHREFFFWLPKILPMHRKLLPKPEKTPPMVMVVLRLLIIQAVSNKMVKLENILFNYKN